jgi:hypothetical protein
MHERTMPKRNPKHHSLKILAAFYDEVESGRKPFEVRWNDRDYRVGDHVHLNCVYDVDGNRILDPTKIVIARTITYVLTGEEWGIMKGYVVLGLGPYTHSPGAPRQDT